MIIFTRVKYKNFLATGNAPIEIDLNGSSTTLIVGRNGAGKSTMSEAICFAMFGRPLRNINKPKLVNSINGRECVVELNFRIGQNEYHIVRGIKPNVFEIHENGKLIPAPASVQDYQTLLETNILHLNYKSFMQVVVLGSASYIPFMRLTTATRRELIEDLLDIEVFSSMNALTKDDLNNIRIDLDKCQQAKSLLLEQRKMAQSFTEHIEEQRLATVQTLEAAISAEQKQIDTLTDELNDTRELLATFDTVRSEHATARAKRQEYEKMAGLIDSQKKKALKEWTFYEDHDTCPTCEQSITEDFKQGRFNTLSKKESDGEKASIQCAALVAKYQQQMDVAERQLTAAGKLETKLHGIEAKLPLHKRRVKDLGRQLTEHSAPKPVQTVDIDDLDDQLQRLDTQHEDFSRKRVIMDAATMLLKDNGIKARIIKHYLPIINKQINHYLNAMDFPIQFTLDEEFSESIKSRYRDDFAYDSFSEGEKKRIDLALLLTWRAVAAIKNSAATNLLILDEVFDSSLDAAGTEEFLKIIAALETDTNVFVISHKTDQLVDKFANTLVFEKTRGFSTIKV